MMLPSNVYVGPKARPYRDFLAQMTWKFDPQPLRQSAHWSNAGPGYAKVPASFKQYTFEEISLFPVQQYRCCHPSSRQVQRFEPLAPGRENLIRDHAGFGHRKALGAGLAEKQLPAIECPTDRRGPVVYGAAVST
jgi:hypothetical protein